MQKWQGLTVPINFVLSILLKDKTIPETTLRQVNTEEQDCDKNVILIICIS